MRRQFAANEKQLADSEKNDKETPKEKRQERVSTDLDKQTAHEDMRNKDCKDLQASLMTVR